MVRSVLQYSHSGTAVDTGRVKFCNIVIFTSAPHGFIAADFLRIRILYLELLSWIGRTKKWRNFSVLKNSVLRIDWSRGQAIETTFFYAHEISGILQYNFCNLKMYYARDGFYAIETVWVYLEKIPWLFFLDIIKSVRVAKPRKHKTAKTTAKWPRRVSCGKSILVVKLIKSKASSFEHLRNSQRGKIVGKSSWIFPRWPFCSSSFTALVGPARHLNRAPENILELARIF